MHTHFYQEAQRYIFGNVDLEASLLLPWPAVETVHVPLVAAIFGEFGQEIDRYTAQ